MAPHENTVVSRLPNRFLRAATQVSQLRQLDPSARRAMAALDSIHPPMPAAWGQTVEPQQSPHHPGAGPAPPAPGHIDDAALGSQWSDPRPQVELAQAPAPVPTPGPAPQPTPSPTTRGQVICVFACRGGAGATTLTVNTAATLARAGKKVCVVDLDLQLGDVFVALDLQPETSIAALAREASTIDGAALRRRLARHNAGFYALTQTGRIDDIDEQLVERMPALLSTLTNEFDYVIVDGIRDFGDYALSVLDMADAVALIVTQDVAAVRRAARVITLFRQLGYDDNKLRLVVNRRVRKAAVDETEIERALQLPVAATVRNDYKRVGGAMDDGALIGDIARTSGVAKDLAKLTQVLAQPKPTAGAQIAQQASPQPAVKRGMFRRLFPRLFPRTNREVA